MLNPGRLPLEIRENILWTCHSCFGVHVYQQDGKWCKKPAMMGATTSEASRWAETISGYQFQFGKNDALESMNQFVAYGFIPLHAGFVVLDADNAASIRLLEVLFRRAGVPGVDCLPFVDTGRGRHYYFNHLGDLQLLESHGLLLSKNKFLDGKEIPQDILEEAECRPDEVALDWRAGANMFLVAPWSRSSDGAKEWQPQNWPTRDPSDSRHPSDSRQKYVRRFPAISKKLLSLIAHLIGQGGKVANVAVAVKEKAPRREVVDSRGRGSNQSIYQEAKKYITPQLIEEYFPNGKWKKDEYYVCSPLRDDRHPTSFSIREDGVWHDFATEEGGDFLNLVSRAKQITRYQAAKMILDKCAPGWETKRGTFQPPEWHPWPGDMPIENCLPFRVREFEERDNRRLLKYRVGVEDDNLAFVVVYTGANNTFTTWYYCGPGHHNAAPGGWFRGLPQRYRQPFSRPLFGVYSLDLFRAGLPVMIIPEYWVENIEHYWWICKEIRKEYYTISWHGGFQNWKYTDWTPLAGLEVGIIHENDPNLGDIRALNNYLREKLKCKGVVINKLSQPKGEPSEGHHE